MNMNNIHKNTHSNNNHKQDGAIFSTEMILVLAVVAIIVAGAFVVGQGMRGNALQDQVITETKALFPQVVSDCLQLNNDLSTCNQARVLASNILSSTTTPCGDTWGVTAAASNITVTYPVDSCAEPSVFGAELASNLNGLFKITASYNNSNNDLTIVYSR